MSCCWLWLFWAYPSFLVDGQLGCWPRRVIPLRIAADRENGGASWRQVGLPAQSLPRRRFRRACVRAYIQFVCVCVYMCMCVCVRTCIYIYMCMCVSTCICMRLYTCVCVCVCILVHRLWVSVSVLQRVDGVMHAHVCSCTLEIILDLPFGFPINNIISLSCTYVCGCIWVWVCICVLFFAESVACTLEQVFEH